MLLCVDQSLEKSTLYDRSTIMLLTVFYVNNLTFPEFNCSLLICCRAPHTIPTCLVPYPSLTRPLLDLYLSDLPGPHKGTGTDTILDFSQPPTTTTTTTTSKLFRSLYSPLGIPYTSLTCHLPLPYPFPFHNPSLPTSLTPPLPSPPYPLPGLPIPYFSFTLWSLTLQIFVLFLEKFDKK